MAICIFQPSHDALSETFIRAHNEQLSGVVGVVHFIGGQPAMNGLSVLSGSWRDRAHRRFQRSVLRKPWSWELDYAVATAVRRCRANVVLAEYGTTAFRILSGCRISNKPLVVHFHGYDASLHELAERNVADYQKTFQLAVAVIAVSRAMSQRLLALGCPSEKLVYSPYGVDCDRFRGAKPDLNGMHFVAVGRMVEKKAPHLTLAAFARVLAELPEARLRMIGDGPLLGVCRDLAAALGVEHAVTFLGAQPHDVVQAEMRNARAFVQHSVTAANGDSEGTPVAVLEAGAMGLPVVATRHAGIPDVVIDGQTGLLVDERDVAGMAQHLISLARHPELAARLGRSAAAHIGKYYTMEKSLRRLGRVLDAAATGKSIAKVGGEIEAELPSPSSNHYRQ